MDYITIIVLVFSFLAVLDRIFGSRFGLAKEFEKAFMLLGNMSLSMIGMIVLAPAIAEAIKPVSEFVSEVLRLDSSIIPASLFANDMGGAPLAVEMAQNGKVGIYEFLTGTALIKNIAPVQDGVSICFNAAVVLSGAFPFIYVVSKLLQKPLKTLGSKVGINAEAALGIISTLVTSATAFGRMDKMDKKGAVMNSAFALSGAFSLGSHLAFTMAFDKSYIVPVVVGKIIAGITALILAAFIYERTQKKV